jgi:ribosomal protein S18 acetylase RimI-like enzyme
MSVTYRLLTRNDVASFRALRLEGLQREPQAFLEDYDECLAQPPDDFQRYFQNAWIAGAFEDGKLVGVTGLYIAHKGKKTRHKGTIWGVYVTASSRGRGIARNLITMMVDQARTLGLELLQLSTDETNAATVGLYQSLGFEPYGVEKHILKLETGYVSDMLMVKFL